jgi:N-methylhydantoinase A
MSDLVRRMVVSKGHDPRDFSLFAYGGAGPVHATGLSRDLGFRSIVVPAGNVASVWSAYGVATSDIKHVYEYAAVFGEPLDTDSVRGVFERLAQTARVRLAEEDIPAESTRFVYEGGLRYRGQLHEVYVPVADGERLDDGAAKRLIAEFERAYARVYGEGAGFREAGVELVDFRLTTVTGVDRPPLRGAAVGDGAARGTRAVRFVGLEASERAPEPVETTLYDGDAVAPGTAFEGPAAIELPGTTIVVPPDHRAERHESGSYVVTQVAR